MAKKTDYKSMSGKDLEKTLREKREALRVFRFSTAGSKTRNMREGRVLRRDIARILTQVNSATTTA